MSVETQAMNPNVATHQPLGSTSAESIASVAPTQQTSPPNQAAADNGEEGVAQMANGKVRMLSADAYSRLRSKSKSQGEREAQLKLEQRAKALGFASAEAMFNHLERGGQQPAQGNRGGQRPQQSQPARQVEEEPDTSPGKKVSYRDARRYEAKIERLQRERELEKKQRVAAERRAKQAQQQADATSAEAELKQVAARSGIADVDYGLTLLQRAIAGKNAQQLAAFDEVKFFEELKASKPHLFGERHVPVTTGAAGSTPPTQAPGQVATQQANGGKADARKMSPEEYRAHLAKRGINIGGVG